MDPRRSPQRIRGAHLANERPNGRIRAGATGTDVVERCVHRRRSYCRCQGTPCQAVRQSRPCASPARLGEQDPKQPIALAELGTLDRAPEHRQLLTESHVLERDCAVASADQRERSEHHDEHGQHALSVVQMATESTVQDAALILAKDRSATQLPTTCTIAATDGTPVSLTRNSM